MHEQGAEMRLVFFMCQAKSYNIPCYFCIAHASGEGPPPYPECRSRAGPPAMHSGAMQKPHGLKIGGPTLPFKKKGVPTLPFIA